MQVKIKKTTEETIEIYAPSFYTLGNEHFGLLDENTLISIKTFAFSGPILTFGSPGSDIEKAAAGKLITENEFRAIFFQAIEQFKNLFQSEEVTQ